MFFEENHPDEFEFYGRCWDNAGHKSWRGALESAQGALLAKTSCLKNYRFSICYENCQHVPGYVTEKIFDSFIAGCVPIYWGPPNIDLYVPKNCYIARGDFASEEELYHFMKTMPKEEYEGYIERIRVYLSSEQARHFSIPSFAQLFADKIEEVIKTNKNDF
jgi:hypothetical protein